MHEHGCRALVELGEQGCEILVAQITARDVRFEDHADRTELADGAIELGDRGGRVGQWEGGELTELARVGALEFGGGVVDVSGQACRGLVVAEVHTRRRDRQHGGADAVRVH